MKSLFPLTLAAFLLSSCTSSSSVDEMELIEQAAPAGKNASLPYLTRGGDGNLYFSWIEKGDSNWVKLNYSQLVDGQWTTPELIATGNDWFVNWADYPMMAVDKDGNKVAHFLAKSSSGTYSYDVNVVTKPAGASNWSDPMVPHTDGTPTEHGFATILPQNDGTFLLAWLDGRNTGGGEHEGHEGHDMGGGAMTIRSARMDMAGALTEDTELDGKVCDCCQTAGIMVGSDPVIAFRDRSDEEIRDMSFVTRVSGNWQKSKPVAADQWNIAGCPVNGPRLAAFGSQFVSAWFTAAGGKPMVKIAFSKGNSEFAAPIVIDAELPLGRVDVVMTNENTAMVSWLTMRNEQAVILVKEVKKDGTMGSERLIAQTSNSRGSGFPQMEIASAGIFFAWTHLIENGANIKMALLEF